jgi:hypothetical protein
MALLITQSAAFIDSSAGAKRRLETQTKPLSPARDWVGASAFTVMVRQGPGRVAAASNATRRDATRQRSDAMQRRCNDATMQQCNDDATTRRRDALTQRRNATRPRSDYSSDATRSAYAPRDHGPTRPRSVPTRRDAPTYRRDAKGPHTRRDAMRRDAKRPHTRCAHAATRRDAPTYRRDATRRAHVPTRREGPHTHDAPTQRQNATHPRPDATRRAHTHDAMRSEATRRNANRPHRRCAYAATRRDAPTGPRSQRRDAPTQRRNATRSRNDTTRRAYAPRNHGPTRPRSDAA